MKRLIVIPRLSESDLYEERENKLNKLNEKYPAPQISLNYMLGEWLQNLT